MEIPDFPLPPTGQVPTRLEPPPLPESPPQLAESPIRTKGVLERLANFARVGTTVPPSSEEIASRTAERLAGKTQELREKKKRDEMNFCRGIFEGPIQQQNEDYEMNWSEGDFEGHIEQQIEDEDEESVLEGPTEQQNEDETKDY